MIDSYEWPTAARAWLFGWVDTDPPGYGRLSSTDITAGYYRWPEFIDQITADIVNCTASVSETGQGSLAWSPSTAVTENERVLTLLGISWLPGDTLLGATALAGDRISAACIPLAGLDMRETDIRRDVEQVIDRQQRSHGYVWGGARVWRATMTLHRSALDALNEGWCLRGKVTLYHGTYAAWGGAGDEAQPWSWTEPTGYLDAHVVGVEHTRWLDDVRQWAEVAMLVTTVEPS